DVLGVHDDLGRQAGALVDLLLHGDAVEDVAELHHAAGLGEDRNGVRIPLRHHLARLHLLAVALLELGAVDHGIALALALPVGLRVVDDRDLAVAVHDHEVAVLALHGDQVDELEETLVAHLEARLLVAPAGGAPGVARALRERWVRLPQRLGRDYADGLAEVGLVATGQVAPVALHAHAAARLAGEHGADLHALQAGVLDVGHLGLVDLRVGVHDDIAGEGIADVLQRHAPEH